MFSFKEVKHAMIITIIGTIILVAILIPLPQLLPDYFDSWVPDILTNKSIWLYVMEHTDFVVLLFPVVTLITIILYLRKKL